MYLITFRRIMSISEYLIPLTRIGMRRSMWGCSTSLQIGCSARESQNSHASRATESSSSWVLSIMYCNKNTEWKIHKANKHLSKNLPMYSQLKRFFNLCKYRTFLEEKFQDRIKEGGLKLSLPRWCCWCGESVGPCEPPPAWLGLYTHSSWPPCLRP